MQPSLPSVSVVIPLYNRRDLIARAVDSVLAQTYSNFELIVVDDGSTDGAGDVVRQYQDSRVRLITQPNGGECAARNRGVAEANNEWIGLLDSDDEWRPGFLEAVVKVAAANQSLMAVFTNLQTVLPDLPFFVCSLREPSILEDYFAFCADHFGRGISSSSVMIRKKALESAGGFPVGIHRSGDTETWVRLGLAGQIACVPEVLAVYHNETMGSATLYPEPVFPEGVKTIQRLRGEGRIPDRFSGSLSRVENIQILQHVRALIDYGDRLKAVRILFCYCSWRHCPVVEILKAFVRLFIASRNKPPTIIQTRKLERSFNNGPLNSNISSKKRRFNFNNVLLRICIFVPNLFGGGAERVMVYLANGLLDRGFEVDLVMALASGPYLNDVATGVRIIDMQRTRTATAILPLARYLRRERPDVIISATEHAHVAAVAAKQLSLLPIPLIMAVQTVLSPASDNRKDWRKGFVKKLASFAYRRTNVAVADSYGTAKQLVNTLGISNHIVQTIYNPVITTRMMELAKMPLEHPFYREGTPPVILGVGSLSPVKDFASLIRAFALVRQDTDCRLIILGDGVERGALEELVKELGVSQDISMPGFAKNPYAHMARASLFALSSLRESMSMVLVEALALGLPVVATNCEFGPREILQNGKYGRLVPVGDPRSLANAIRCALNEPIQTVPSEVLRPFDFDFAVDRYADLVRTLAGKTTDTVEA